MKLSPSYKRPLTASLVFHLLILIGLSASFSMSQPYAPPAKKIADKPIIQAVNLDAKQLKKEMAKLSKEKQQKKAKEVARVNRLKSEAVAAKKQLAKLNQEKLKAKKELAKRTKQAAADMAKLKKEEAAAKKKIETMKAEEKKLVANKANDKLIAKKAKERLADAKKLAAKSLKEQMQKEQAELNSARTQQINHVTDKYKGLILQAIAQQWIVPDKANKKLSAEFMIRLANNGTVLSVRLLHSSGDAALDRSAKAAVYKASPLPVPSDPEVFDKFRELRLTVRPEEIISRASA